MLSYDFRARVGPTRSNGVTLKSLFTLAPDVSFQHGVLKEIYVKIWADLDVEKVPFLWSTIYPANFGAFNEHLELVPSGIRPE